MNLIHVFAVCVLFITCHAQTVQQEKSACHAVRAFVKEKYPLAKSRMIIEEMDGFRVVLKSCGNRYTCRFTPKGKWLKTEKKIQVAQLPGNVNSAFSKCDYKSGRIIAAIEITNAQNADTDYIVKAVYDKHNPENDTAYNVVTELHTLFFTISGKLISDKSEPAQNSPPLPWGDD